MLKMPRMCSVGMPKRYHVFNKKFRTRFWLVR